MLNLNLIFMKQRTKISSLLGIALTVLAGCDSKKPETPVDPNAPIIKIESHEDYKEVQITGRSYTPGFNIDQKVNVSYGTPIFDDAAHEHEIPIQISQPDKYFLHIEIDNRTFVKEVTPEKFRDAGKTAMVKYVEKRRAAYKPNVPESEKLSDDFNGLEILSLELKK